MTDNEKIARWAGWFYDEPLETFFAVHNGYPTIPLGVFDLLNVLVEKEISPALEWSQDDCCWVCTLVPMGQEGYCVLEEVEEFFAGTIHEAITSAVLQVIDKEDSNE